MTPGASRLCGRAIALVGAVTMDTCTISNDCDTAGAEIGRSDFGSAGFAGIAPTVVPLPARGLLPRGAFGALGLFRRNRGRRAA